MIFPSHIPFDGVHILDCAGVDDMRTARHLHDDLIHICPVLTVPCETRRQFFTALRRLADQCVEGYRPILHVDAHGSQDRGLQIGSEMVSWNEFGERITRINAASKNGLGVVLAACHGIHGFSAVDLLWPSPFAYLIGPPDQVSQGDLQAAMSRFYRGLLLTGNLSQAATELGKGFVVIRSALFFYMVFRRVFLAQSMGRAAKAHVEDLVSRAVKDGIVINDDQLAVVRKTIRFNNRYPKQTYLRIGNKFLHGQPLVDFDEFVASIRTEVPGQRSNVVVQATTNDRRPES